MMKSSFSLLWPVERELRWPRTPRAFPRRSRRRAEDTTPSIRHCSGLQSTTGVCAREKTHNIHRASPNTSLWTRTSLWAHWREKRQPRRTLPQHRHCLTAYPAELQQHQHFSRYLCLLRLRMLYYQLSFLLSHP